MVDILETIERCKLSDMLASISADGAATEGVIQREVAAIFERKSSNQQAAWKIPPPSLSSSVFSPVEISSVWIGTTPTAMGRDPKHVGKNLLNSSNSGGRAIIGGTGCVGHQDFLTLIRVEDSSRKILYNRDAETRDRQDDNAAHRAFSAATLELAADECNAGNLDQDAVVFLFLCGELHDAIQNRSLQPLERVKRLLTVCYAFEGWSKFVRVFPEYSGDHFLSAATLDGVYKVVNCCIALIRNYRDYWPSEVFLPWRHGTEMVEHFFGSLRKIVPEFDALDFLQAASKISLLMDFSLQVNASQTDSSTGYHHTYDDTTAINLSALGSYPSDTQIIQASQEAVRLARDLLEATKMWPNLVEAGARPPNQFQEDIMVDEDAHDLLVDDPSPAELVDCALDQIRNGATSDRVTLQLEEQAAVESAICALTALDIDVEDMLDSIQTHYDQARQQQAEAEEGNKVQEELNQHYAEFQPAGLHEKAKVNY
ncbi:hypothetical protein MVLG_07240 [Microbotryum lychnidis-dioicae p1A1 Lamole]|uniref:Uncharacterized protein n=1 Tax=Microbotryum lychnidis-dioicae (strain p1A1 Lamole / MvSl-1064) TaxID=683840 RepID=U5HJR2_USTV1|nr:hypothetical protein MVLG_07240 [Microbotryum lychnidis-dioicae p1A1 Lamole]|eukprot:KDE02189.1 hypothetical protein MVLG_07240 [Microbotryum lychnidis-dioicae p1A1 Lamole]